MDTGSKEARGPSGELELVERAARGDADAFDALVEAHKQFVYRTAVRVVRNAATAEDVAQEVFVRVYRSLAGLEDRARFRPWLHRIAIRTAINHLQKRRAEEGMVHSMSAAVDPPAVRFPEPDREAWHRELGEAIRTAIDELPEEQRVAIVLCDLEGLSYEEIAQVQGVPRGTVMSRIHYGRKKLRERLSGLVEGTRP